MQFTKTKLRSSKSKLKLRFRKSNKELVKHITATFYAFIK